MCVSLASSTGGVSANQWCHGEHNYPVSPPIYKIYLDLEEARLRRDGGVFIREGRYLRKAQGRERLMYPGTVV